MSEAAGDAGRYQRLQDVFERALRLSGEARARFLAEACADDIGLRAEVDALLAADSAGADAFCEQHLARERSALDHAFDAGLASPAPDTRVRQYRILEKLGEGGMGEVFVAFDEVLKRRVALKTIRDKKALRPGTLERLRREARTLSKLDHPRLCRIFDYLEGAERDYLVLEYVEGRTLAEAIAAGVARADAWRLAEQIAEALAAAHAAGVVHRDLKPANLMVTPEGDARVLDFGLARLEDGDDASIARIESAADLAASHSSWDLAARTREGALLGTPLYMSPEQARGEAVGAPSDLYSLGLVLHELFTGQSVYPRALALDALLERVRRGAVEPAPDLDRDLLRLLARLFDPSPTNRPTARETLERLRWIRTRPGRRWRLAGVATLVLAAAGAWAKYTIDLSRRERQAENLIDYLVTDLRRKLEPLGKLDILADVGHQALAYFAEVPESDWTEPELERRCEAFYQLGEVLLQQGDSGGAREFFEAALAYATDMVRRRPDSAEWLFQRGQCEFYVGQVDYQLGRHGDARPSWEAYLATSDELVRRDPDSQTNQVERLYALTNLAVLAEVGDDQERAVEMIGQVTEGWRGLLSSAPDDVELLGELADALSWQARGQESIDLQEAIAVKSEELAVRERLRIRSPEDPHLEFKRATSLYQYAELRRHDPTGDDDTGWQEAVRVSRELVARDESNADWRNLLGIALAGRGDRSIDTDAATAARESIAEASEVFDDLCARDSSNRTWRKSRAWCRMLMGKWEAIDGDPRSASRILGDLLDEGVLEERYRGWARLWRAVAWAGMGRKEEAGAELTALSADRGLAGRRTHRALALRGTALALLGRTIESEAVHAALLARGYRDPFLEECLGNSGAPVVGEK